MESVVTILVESLMKVSTKCLASGSVFAIFELPDGTRCWAGQQRLRNQFQTAGIFSRQTDKELLVDQDSLFSYSSSSSSSAHQSNAKTIEYSERQSEDFQKKLLLSVITPTFNLPMNLAAQKRAQRNMKRRKSMNTLKTTTTTAASSKRRKILNVASSKKPRRIPRASPTLATTSSSSTSVKPLVSISSSISAKSTAAVSAASAASALSASTSALPSSNAALSAAALSAAVAANTASITKNSLLRPWKDLETTLVNVKEEDDASSSTAQQTKTRTRTKSKTTSRKTTTSSSSSSPSLRPFCPSSPMNLDAYLSGAGHLGQSSFEEALASFPSRDSFTDDEHDDDDEIDDDDDDDGGNERYGLEEDGETDSVFLDRETDSVLFDQETDSVLFDQETDSVLLDQKPAIADTAPVSDEDVDALEDAGGCRNSNDADSLIVNLPGSQDAGIEEAANVTPLPPHHLLPHPHLPPHLLPPTSSSATSRDHVAQEGRVFFYKSSVGKYPMATWKNYCYAFTQIKRRGDGAYNRVIFRCTHTDVCRGRIHVDLDRKCVVKSLPHNFDATPPDFETFCKRMLHRTRIEPTIETFLPSSCDNNFDVFEGGDDVVDDIT